MNKNIRSRGAQHFSVDFKRMVIGEYLSGNSSQQALQTKYGIGGNSAILSWMRKLGYCDKMEVSRSTFEGQTTILLAKKTDLQKQSGLQQRIKELERQLQDAQLRAEAFERIIEKAEQEFKLPIRKKPNTK
jgi:transposase